MNIDPSKVNLSEKDIEDWLWENPQAIALANGLAVEKWTARQFHVPSGIIDLLGIDGNGNAVVVEVKNVALDAKAITQVSRYAFDIRKTLEFSGVFWPNALAVLVGKTIDDRTMMEAEGCDVKVFTFGVAFELDISAINWTKEYRAARINAYCKLAESDVIVSYQDQRSEGNEDSQQPDADQAAASVVTDYEARTGIEG